MSQHHRNHPEESTPQHYRTLNDAERDAQREQSQVPDTYVIEAMAKFGGSFVKRLADLMVHADRVNRYKIIATWPEYWLEYQDFGRDLWEQDQTRKD